jgi:hypothetical protein
LVDGRSTAVNLAILAALPLVEITVPLQNMALLWWNLGQDAIYVAKNAEPTQWDICAI